MGFRPVISACVGPYLCKKHKVTPPPKPNRECSIHSTSLIFCIASENRRIFHHCPLLEHKRIATELPTNFIKIPLNSHIGIKDVLRSPNLINETPALLQNNYGQDKIKF